MEMYFRLRQLDGEAWWNGYRELARNFRLPEGSWHFAENYADQSNILFDIHGHIAMIGDSKHMTRQETINRLHEEAAAGKEMRYRYGFGYRGAEWRKSSIEELTKSLEDGNWAHYDLSGGEDWFGINFYSANDMW